MTEKLYNLYIICRIREAKTEGVDVVDVDGSYLYRKTQQTSASTSVETCPGIPLFGWESVDESNRMEMAQKIPNVTHGKYFNSILNYVSCFGLPSHLTLLSLVL